MSDWEDMEDKLKAVVGEIDRRMEQRAIDRAKPLHSPWLDIDDIVRAQPWRTRVQVWWIRLWVYRLPGWWMRIKLWLR
jgi:hypothetical protein